MRPSEGVDKGKIYVVFVLIMGGKRVDLIVILGRILTDFRVFVKRDIHTLRRSHKPNKYFEVLYKNT